MQSFTEIIDQWPSVTVLAVEIDHPPQRVFKWKYRNRIPEQAWGAVLKAAAKRNIPVTPELLIRLAAKTRKTH